MSLYEWIIRKLGYEGRSLCEMGIHDPVPARPGLRMLGITQECRRCPMVRKK